MSTSTRYIDDTEYPTLYYNLTSLFNKASLMSLYKIQGQDIDIDNFSITESERDFFNLKIKAGAREVFKTFSRLSQGITDAVQFQEDDLSSTSTIDESACVVYIYEKPTYWDDNMDDLFDQKVEEALISYILKEWFKMKSLKPIYNDEVGYFEDALKEIKSVMNMRTTRPLITHRNF